MMEVPSDPKEVVEAALRFEAEGHKILTDARDKATQPLSKATFEFLAAQEVKHMETIRAFASALSAGGEFDASSVKPVTLLQAGDEIKGIFGQFKSAYEAAAGRADERMEVYEVALQMERRGHDFYREAADRATSEAARKLYAFLAEEEAKHFAIIQDTRDFLKQPDAFMAIEERWMTT